MTRGGSGHVFHITERSSFAAALETAVYEAPSLSREGFIHCSTRAQIALTLSRFYAGKSGLVLLCIDAERLSDQLRYEPADGDSFPHCYGKIPLELIVAVFDLPVRSDGGFDLPPELTLFDD